MRRSVAIFNAFVTLSTLPPFLWHISMSVLTKSIFMLALIGYATQDFSF
jgi:hypothetical protein